MPQVLPAVAAWITTEIAIATGVTSLTALTVIGLTVTVAVDVAATVAVSAATSALSRPPEPQAGKVTAHQERPQRRFGVGTVRVSGPFMLRETKDNHLVLVIALPEGPVDHYGQFWLNDDKVTLVGDVVQPGDDNRYPDGRVTIETRLGEDTETAYTTPATYVPTLWDADHRGDGIPSLMLHGVNGDLQDMSWAFPNGEPTPSVEAFYRAYDWRDVGQDRLDDTTWTFSANPIVWAVNILWRRFGANWDVRFAPVLDDLTVEADYCDDAVDLKAGGTEARYRCGFFFEATNAASDVMAILLASMDGWWATRFDGAYMIKAGRFDDPFDGGVVFGDVEVLDYSFDPGPTPDQARNVLVVSYTDPANDYSKVETTPWRDEADILQRGEERSEDFYPWAVQANGQVRRLAKRKALRNGAARVQVRTPLSARRGLSRRYVGLRVSECADLDGVTMEVSEATIDLASASIVWTGLLLDASIDVWDADTEEGDGPVAVERPAPTPGGIPSAADDIAFTPGTAAGSANYSFRAPSSFFDHAKILRSLDSNVANAVQVGSDIVGAGGAVFTGTITTGVGNYFWVQTFNAAGTGGTPEPYASNPVAVDYYGPGAQLLPNPNAFGSWTANHSGGTSADPVTTSDSVVAPDGATSADSIVFTRGTGVFSRLEQSGITVVNATSYDFDVWLKAPVAGLSIAQRLDSNNGAALNLTTSWQRYTFTATSTSTAMEVQLLLFSSISGSPAGPVTVHAAFAKLHAH